MNTQLSVPIIPGYQITGEIAQGGMATVYAGISESTGEPVAIKVMATMLGLDSSFRRRFLEECQITKDLSHRHIVRIPAFGCLDAIYYMVMAYLPGGTLADRMTEGISDDDAVRITRQVAEALGYAHRRGIVHRDIKPSNVLFDGEGEAVLSDFGICKAVQASTKMTRTGMVVGTPEYMSPEQSAGRPLDGRSDLYSLGAMFYEMLAGELPYRAEDPFALALKHRDDPIPRLPGRLARWQPTIERLLAKRPEERFADAASLLAALDDSPLALRPTTVRQAASSASSGRVTPAMGATRIVTRASDVAARLTPAMGATAFVPPTDQRARATPAMGSTIASPSGDRSRATPAMGIEAPLTADATATARAPEATPFDLPTDDPPPRARQWALRGSIGVLPVAALGLSWLMISPSEKPVDPPRLYGARSVQIGSAPEEIDRALELCREQRQDCQRAWYEDERLRSVSLTPFVLDRTEVTNEEFARFVQATGYTTDAEKLGYSTRFDPRLRFAVEVRGYSWKTPDGPGSTYTDRPNHPVTHVSHNDAEAYCLWRNARLPTEAEWEYAARGDARRVFPWGGEWKPTLAHWQDGRASGARPVGSFAGGNTPDGLVDLAGNVWEWTSTRENGQAVLKGGSWSEANPANLRAAARRLEDPGVPALDNGFRCARDSDQWPKEG